MNSKLIASRRWIALAVAFCAWVGLGLQFGISARFAMRSHHSVTLEILQLFSFFTIISNTLTAIGMSAESAMHHLPHGHARTSWLGALTTSMSLVSLTYETMLRQSWLPGGAFFVSDLLVHDATPILLLFYWLLFAPKHAIGFKDVGVWLIYPALYCAFTFTRGQVTGWYPYWFANVARIGVVHALLNTLTVLIAFALIGSLLMLASKRGMSKNQIE